MMAAIHQPHYLPWCGYLDKMDQADVFVILDTVPFSKGDWQNRNRLKTAQGWQWITVPVRHVSGQVLMDVEIENGRGDWRRKHRNALKTHYAATPFYEEVRDTLDPLWDREWARLAPLAEASTRGLVRLAGITTPIQLASELGTLPEEPDQRLIQICRAVGADIYLAGSAGLDYMEMSMWEASGIEVRFQRFEHPVYPQPFGEFLAGMSSVDLLCNCGSGGMDLIRTANGRASTEGTG